MTFGCSKKCSGSTNGWLICSNSVLAVPVVHTVQYCHLSLHKSPTRNHISDKKSQKLCVCVYVFMHMHECLCVTF
jgi:hypothetical protein